VGEASGSLLFNAKRLLTPLPPGEGLGVRASEA